MERPGSGGLRHRACIALLLASGPATAHEDEEITVYGRASSRLGDAITSTAGYVGAHDLARRPLLRAGELLEAVPGIAVTQHSGTGKANQYFLRGFNLDHGTDFAAFVDGVPLNLRTHGHGQGYLDLNPLIPELVDHIEFGKGPHFADVGDFGNAGFARYALTRHVHGPMASLTVGEYDYRRVFGANGFRLGDGELIVGAEGQYYDGPWEIGEDGTRFNGLLRYVRGDRDAGESLTAMAYDARWDATDQVPARAVASGEISRFGSIDPTLGGASSRQSVNAEIWRSTARGGWHANAFAVHSDFELFSNFTYLLDDPVNGDQITQRDGRWLSGFNAEYAQSDTWFGRDTGNRLGIQVRHDAVDRLDLLRSRARVPVSTVRLDEAAETSLGLYAASETRWTGWLRTVAALRGDLYWFDVEALDPANAGTRADHTVSPKFGLVFGPWAATEFYLNVGRGFHSNDARGTTTNVDPVSGDPVSPVDPLVAGWGVDGGVRTVLFARWHSTFTLWMLESDSELVFVGDAGTTEASGGSRRHGLEWTNVYAITEWLDFDLDVALSQAAFRDAADDEVPNSVGRVITGGLSLALPNGIEGAFRVRHFGDVPLIEDGSVHAGSTTVVNARAGYRFSPSLAVHLDVFNLFDSDDADITYFFPSCLASDPAGACDPAAPSRDGVPDIHSHPVEPRALRLSLQVAF
ncbi:MAG: TonB-dependent receptor [Gammaproteobacteria bacterium]